jgi:hypothetical protein
MKWVRTSLMIGLTAIALTTLTAGVAAAHDDHRDRDYPVRDTEHVQRSFAFTGAGPYRLEIDNVFGSIQVAAHDARTVELTITKTLLAKTAERLDAARREVTLDIKEETSLVSLYVDGPFRDCDRERRQRVGWRWQDPEYEVRYDFVLRVPRQVTLALRTVLRGDIRIEGTTGDFDISNVNGGIEMLDIAGTGKVTTVNKDLRVVFRTNPTGASSFKTINGDVIVCFQPALSADLRMKSFNGGFYTDFETSMLPAMRPVSERRDGKFVYKADHYTGARVGSGGPELKFETFNGDIRILLRRK